MKATKKRRLIDQTVKMKHKFYSLSVPSACSSPKKELKLPKRHGMNTVLYTQKTGFIINRILLRSKKFYETSKPNPDFHQHTTQICAGSPLGLFELVHEGAEAP